MRDFWKDDTKRILKALTKLELEEADADRENRKAEDFAKETSILEEIDEKYISKGVPLTYQLSKSYILDYMQSTGITNHRDLPESLKRLSYSGQEEDLAIDARLSHRHYTLNQQITMADLRGIQDERIKKKWLDIAKLGTGLRSTGGGVGSSTYADRAIKSVVTAHTMEQDVDPSNRSPKWVSNYEQASRHYNALYNSLKAEGASDIDAHREAIKSVETTMTTPVPMDDGKGNIVKRMPWDQRQPSGFNRQGAIIENKVIASITKNKDILQQTTPWEGEQPHLDAAAKYLIKSRRGDAVAFPEYYRRMARKLGLNPERLLLNRLTSTGALKEGEIKLPEEENLPLDQQIKLGVKPSASKTYGVSQDNDYAWMLDTSKAPMALKNGGYTAIRNSKGKYENIEEILDKPLAEINMGDIYGLAMDGYTDIGIYGITPQGFVDLIESGAVPLDTSFDIRDQDLLYLARLRQKANSAKKYSGVTNRYRRLVNISEEDRTRFTQIAGDLPTWLQLDNLLPEVAKELIRSTTQQE